MFSNENQGTRWKWEQHDGADSSTQNILNHAECAWVRCDTINEKNVRVCASGQVCCPHLPSHSGQLPLSGREIKKTDNHTSTEASQLLEVCEKCPDGGRAFWLMLTTSDLSLEVGLNQSVSWCFDRSMLSYLTIFHTTYCLSNRADASSKSRRTKSTTVNLVPKKKMMSAEGVLLRNIQTNLCSASQDTVALKDQTDWASVAFQLLG